MKRKTPRGLLDGWLRERLDSPREVVERVVQRSLHGDRARRARPLLAWSIVVTATVLAILVLALRLGADSQRTAGLDLPTLTNASGRAVLVLPGSGPPAPDEHAAAAARGPAVPLIFNRKALVAAVVPGGRPEILIAGGES